MASLSTGSNPPGFVGFNPEPTPSKNDKQPQQKSLQEYDPYRGEREAYHYRRLQQGICDCDDACNCPIDKDGNYTWH